MTFWCLVCLMTEYDCRGFYEEGTPKTIKMQAMMPEFLKQHIPRVCQHYIDEDEEYEIENIGNTLV